MKTKLIKFLIISINYSKNEGIGVNFISKFGTYFGQEVNSAKQDLTIHPYYFDRTDPTFDVALLKLDRPVNITNNGDYYDVNMLCLPPKNITPTKREDVFISGWGWGFRGEPGVKKKAHLKIGGRILDERLRRGNYFDIKMRFFTYSIYENGVDLTRVCHV